MIANDSVDNSLLETQREDSLGYLASFRPLPFLRSGWAQTVGAVFWPQWPGLAATARHIVPLPDGDRLVVLENRPRRWREGDRIVVLVHGLASSSASKDLVRLTRRLVRSGRLVMRVNLRGCGPGFGLAKRLYHSGRSDDLRQVIRWLAANFPSSPVTQIGFSLGANITLKMAGEDGPVPSGRLDSVVGVSTPLDLAACVRRMQEPSFRFFDRYFVGVLRRHVARLHRRFPELPAVELPQSLTMQGFDDHYTAPMCGFRDAADYYAQSSCEPFVSRIGYRTLLLCALDDPIVDARCYERLPRLPQVQLVMSEHGGHVGFLGRAEGAWDGVHWMDALLVRWLARLPARSQPGRT